MKKFTFFVLGGVLLAATSCGPSEKPDSESDTATKTPVTHDTSDVFKGARSIFYSMPSPMELASLIKSAGGTFHKDLLHDPNKANTYQSTVKRSLALGLYGADLSYSSVYNQQGEAVKYLAASKRLGETIGIQEAFSANLIERANANLSNRDSMFSIMTEMYWQTNSQLKEENRDQIALIVMAGGWAEGLYIGCNAVDPSNPQPEIEKRMAEQKFAAQQIEEMFKAYSGDVMVSEVYEMYKPVLELFSGLEMTEEPTSMATDENTGQHTIGGTKEIDFGPEDLAALTELSNALRAKIVEP